MEHEIDLPEGFYKKKLARPPLAHTLGSKIIVPLIKVKVKSMTALQMSEAPHVHAGLPVE
jgi:hypothetical protein